MNQQYENYRKLTVEYTDIQEERFIGTLGLIIQFIDRENDNYSSRKYKKLQNLIDSYFPKRDLASVRKSINQFVKLGFIDFNLTSYHERSKEFIKAVTNEQRSEIFTEIFITNASFNRSVTKDDNFKDVKFIFKTLSEVGELSTDNIAALMSIDNHYELYPNGYINRDKLDQLTRSEQVQAFKSRKYNQIGYCINFLKQLDNITFVNQNLYFLDKAPDPIISDKRDSTQQAIYKDDLMVESNSKCMVKNLAYPSLRAAHIKPWKDSTSEEKVDAFLIQSKCTNQLIHDELQGYYMGQRQHSLILALTLIFTLIGSVQGETQQEVITQTEGLEPHDGLYYFAGTTSTFQISIKKLNTIKPLYDSIIY